MRSIVLSWLSVSLVLFLPGIQAQKNYTFQELERCSLNTTQLAALGEGDILEPCIIFDEKNENVVATTNPSTTVTFVQVTPADCGNHRDGAVIGVQYLNKDNDGKGTAIGFNEDYFVSFRLVSVIAGNKANLTEDEYERRHVMILNSMIQSLASPYIVGSCSFAAAMDKGPALENKAVVMSQVGPPGFYKDENPYVFGFHINSDTYPLPNVRALEFFAAEKENDVDDFPVFVVSRTKSEFFQSTCQSAIDNLKVAGFNQVTELFYDHAGDHDEDGQINQYDDDFLIDLADKVCPPGSGDREGFHPAIFMCTLTEQDTILKRWLENGCSPISLWLTAATWGWASNNPDRVPYFLGGGQWHPAFKYSDKYFPTGRDLLNYNRGIYNYLGTYDQVVSYAIPILFAQHLASHYRVIDYPDPESDFANEESRELLRRDMLVLNAETIFGPVSFNEDQRNIGRGAAGSQWLPLNGENWFENALVSPLLQAQAQLVVPSLNTLNCEAGQFVNDTLQVEQGALLLGSCSVCPDDTFAPPNSRLKQCNQCPAGSSTEDMEVKEYCIIRKDNLLPSGMLAFGYTAVGITWLLSLGFITWVLFHKDDIVVKVSQVEFLVLICIGTIISSSTVIALGLQAGSDEDTSMASLGCTLAPFLYAIGWVLQYSSLTAKTFRLYKVMQYKDRIRRKTVKFSQMFRIVVAALLIDLVILISWTTLSPLEYQRFDLGKSIDDETGMIIIETVGRCAASNPDYSSWAFAGPLLAFHLIMMVTTNVLLYQVKDVTDRYQEQKFVGMASIFMFEILMVGIPVFIAVNDSPLATFVVLLSFIALDDIGLLCFIFIPKIVYQRKGLEEGVNFGESIMRDTYRRASTREYSRRSFVSKNASSINASNRFDMDSDYEAEGKSIDMSGRVTDINRASKSYAETSNTFGIPEESSYDIDDENSSNEEKKG